ncbi:hypothetical protein [Stieleria bergensis]|uniref:hypothetical protein n=1 Tax=Stieleria bergensis TaxID=2528025 RepID=UPI003AF39B34
MEIHSVVNGPSTTSTRRALAFEACSGKGPSMGLALDEGYSSLHRLRSTKAQPECQPVA